MILHTAPFGALNWQAMYVLQCHCTQVLISEQYTQFVNIPYPTPLWSGPFTTTDVVIAISIDNSSVFVPGGNISNAQFGFRRTELIAQLNSTTQLTAISQVGTTAFHFSIAADDSKPLNLTHEYQVVFIEPSDGSHVFGAQLGKHTQC